MSAVGFDPYFSSSYKHWYAESSPRVTQRGRSRTKFSSYTTSLSSDRLHYASPSRTSTSLFLGSPARSVDIDISSATQVSSEFRAVRTQEKAQLQDLNDRFAGYIEHVHELEQQNRALQAEMLLLQQRHADPSHLRGLYEQELRSLRTQVEEARVERQVALRHRESMEDSLRSLQAGYEEELVSREDTERRLPGARKEADDVALIRLEMEKKVDMLCNELEFLKKVHEGEISELQTQVQYGAQIAIETEAIKPDLSSALRDIRVQYETLAAKNMQSAEEWFRGKMGHLTESVAQHSDAVRNSKDEVGEFRRQLRACVLEIDACKGLNEALEKQLRDVEDRQSTEVSALQETIGDLEDELRTTKGEMGRYLKEYQDLLHVKMALDIEIAAYRKLLEGEESRFNVGMASLVGTYSAGPVYSRPMFALSTLSSGAPFLLGSRLLGGDEVVASQGAVTSQTQEDDEEEEEVKEEEAEEKEGEEEDTKEGEEGVDEDEAAAEEEDKGDETIEETEENQPDEEEKGGDEKQTEDEEGLQTEEKEEGGDEEKDETQTVDDEKDSEKEEEKAEQRIKEAVQEEHKTEKDEEKKGRVEAQDEQAKEVVEPEPVKDESKGKPESKHKGKEEPEKPKEKAEPEKPKEKAEPEKLKEKAEPEKPKEKAESEKPKEMAESEKTKGKDEGEKGKSEKKESVKQEKPKEVAEKPKVKK